MLFRKNRLTVDEMIDAEKWIEHNWDDLAGRCKSEEELSKHFNLDVKYVSPPLISQDVEAELDVPERPDSNGVIRINKDYETKWFSYLHEIMHYVLDVRKGNKVNHVYPRKTTGGDKEHHEQVIDYYAAAIAMGASEIREDIERYDKARPKYDELQFIRELCNKYRQDRKAVIRRIREVRSIDARLNTKKT